MTDKGKLIRQRENVAALIGKELKVGSSSRDIEDFLAIHKIPGVYDEFLGRYESISWASKFHAITIYIDVDDRKQMTRYEVRDSFIAP